MLSVVSALCDDDKVRVETGSVDTATAGLYTLTYTATDSAGNIGSASRLVTVIAPVAPVEPVASTTTP